MITTEDFVVAGVGEADQPQPDLIDAKARAIIRYADPAAWITAAAVARAIAAGIERLEPWRHDVGMALVSDDGPGDTMAQVHTAADAGFSSPLRYAAASPGSLAGVACIAFGFRGPTLNLAMRPAEGVPIALLMSKSWLARGTARAMVLAVFTATGTAAGSARVALLGPKALFGTGDPLTDEVTRWLEHAGS